MTIRSFLAIRLPDPIRTDLGGIQERLKEINATVKWVKPDNIHLTLKFFGNIGDDDPDRIDVTVSNIVVKERPLVLRGDGVGFFPSIKSPRVIWIGLSGDVHRLKDIQMRIERELEAIGFKAEDRLFSPHLTIGRIKTKVDRTLVDGVAGLKGYQSEPFEAREIILFKSDLHPSGPAYTPLRTIPFGEKNF